MATRKDVRRLFRQMAARGVNWGGELLLEPSDALALVDALESLGVPLLGASTWYRVPDVEGAIAEDQGIECAVPEEVLY